MGWEISPKFCWIEIFCNSGHSHTIKPCPPLQSYPYFKIFQGTRALSPKKAFLNPYPWRSSFLFFPEWDSHQNMLSHHAFSCFFSAFLCFLFMFCCFKVFVALAEPDLARSKCCFCYLHGLWHGGSNLVSEPERQLRYVWIQSQSTNDIPHTFI